MMRWIAKLLAGLGLIGTACVMSGCTQRLFIPEVDYNQYKKHIAVDLENDYQLPKIHVTQRTAPKTVRDPEKRKPRHMTLAEAMAIALENGTFGTGSEINPGQPRDEVLDPSAFQQFSGSSNSIRVLSMAPAVRGAAIEATVSRFDVKSVTSMRWIHTDQQVQGLGSFNNGQFANFETGFYKLLGSGGAANVTYGVDYTNLSQAPTAFPIQNPAYLAKLSLGFEQPLLRGFGTQINQILGRHPGAAAGSAMSPLATSFLNNSPAAGSLINDGQGFDTTNGILVTRLRFDQERAQFERTINILLLDVEASYWNLYGSYINLYAAEQGMRLARVLWQNAQVGFGAGKIALGIVKRAEGQYRLFQADRIAALATVLENERILRQRLGICADDDYQIIPIDAPTLAPYEPCWAVAHQEALTLRPELVAARQELKVQQFQLMEDKNGLWPDLRFVSRYEITGLGSTMDGNGQVLDQSTGQFRSTNALRNLTTGHFNNWTLGLTLNIPIGYRFEHAALRAAHLRLVRAYMSLKNEEKKAESFLVKTYRDLINNYELIKHRRAQRTSFAQQLREAEIKKVIAGEVYDESTLQAQRDFVNAMNQEFQAVVQYNISLAQFQFAKGTLMQHNNIAISEGPLPECAHVRAVEHERQRSKALLLRERAKPVPHLTCGPEGCSPVPVLSDMHAPTVPALTEGAKMPLSPPTLPQPRISLQPPTQDEPVEQLPAPRTNMMNNTSRPQAPAPHMVPPAAPPHLPENPSLPGRPEPLPSNIPLLEEDAGRTVPNNTMFQQPSLPNAPESALPPGVSGQDVNGVR